jgi:predicted nucleic acid-binding protein
VQFVDANVFLRFLTRDDPARAERVKALLERAERGEISLTTSESVIAELVLVLSSRRLYGLNREQVRTVLLPIMLLKGLMLPGREVFLRALDLYAGSIVDFIDALVIARMEEQKVTEVYSYDEHLAGFEEVKRLEP